MQLNRHRSGRTAALILALIALASCSRVPTAPQPASGQNLGQEPTQDVIATLQPDDPSPAPSAASLVGSKLIDGRVGGVMSVGKWKLVVPRGAYDGIGTITIAIPDTSVDKCDLSISPVSLNHFKEEVDLRFQCSTLREADRRDMRWWNPSTQSWVVIKSWTNDSDITRCAPLKHFSSYASGKAGW